MARADGRLSLPTIRGAVIIFRMWVEGWTPSTQEVADYLDMEHSGAFRLMERLSGEFSLYQDGENRWRRAGH